MRVREAHTLFRDNITAELMHHCTNDALTNYFQVHPSDALTNMDYLEALVVALRQKFS